MPARPTWPARGTPVRARAAAPRADPATVLVTLPTGTLVTVEFQQTLSSTRAPKGRSFRSAWPSRCGCRRHRHPRRFRGHGQGPRGQAGQEDRGRSSLAVEFVSVRLPNGETLPFAAAFSEQGQELDGKDVGIIAGAAAGGAILGNQVFDDDGSAKGALIGAAAGAIATARPAPNRW